QPPERGRCNRQTAVGEGLSGVRDEPCRRYAADLSRAHRQIRVAPRGRDDRDQAGERRAVQALGYALALASGVLLALSFPQFGHPAFSWIALAPLLVALASAGSMRLVFLVAVTT